MAKSNALLGLALSLAFLSIAGATYSTRAASAGAAQSVDAFDLQILEKRGLAIPVKGVAAKELRDNFAEGRAKRHHEAIDILAPRGTPVIATGDGRVVKLFTSLAGGITVYQFDPDERFAYYYAHLDRYAEGLVEGSMLKRGELVGYVGTSGNAPKNTPHLHFAIFRLGPEKRWWKGAPVNPYPFLAAR